MAFLCPPRTQARDPGLEANSSAHQPRQPRGDSCEVPPDAESPQPGKSSPQDDENLPTVRRKAVKSENASVVSKARFHRLT